MIGIYSLLKKKPEVDFLDFKDIPQEKFSSQAYSTKDAYVKLVYPNFKSEDAHYYSGNSWILVDGVAFNGETPYTAKELFELCENQSISAVKNLNGEYFLSYYEGAKDKLYFVSDRMGQRQHCFAESEDGYSIAPNPGGALDLLGKKKEINKESLYYFMNSKKLRLNRETIWQGCDVLNPAIILTYSNLNVVSQEYWKLSYKNPENTVDLKELTDIYRNAVNIRVTDGIKSVLTLTGGLDSRTMLCALDENKYQDVTAITSGMRGCTEVEYAREVAEKVDISHNPFELNPEVLFSPESLEYFENEDIDLVIQGQWFPFLNKYKEKNYLLHGLDLDVTIGGIYLTDELFEIDDLDDLVNYINKEAFVDLELSKKLFKENKYKEYSEVVNKSVQNSISDCKEDTLQETYDHFIVKNSMNRVILQRYRAIRNKIETYSPMYDKRLIDFYLKVPIIERRNYKLFHPFMLEICGGAAEVRYQRTNLPANVPVEFWRTSQENENKTEELYRDIARKTEGKRFVHYNGYYTNIDEWLRFNETWKKATYNLLQSDKSIVRRDWLNEDYLDDLITKHQRHMKNNMSTIMRMMSAEIFLRIANGDSATEISQSINN